MALKDLFPTKLSGRLSALFAPGRGREEILGELEERLLLADIHMPLVERILAGVSRRSRGGDGAEKIREALRQELLTIVSAAQRRPALEDRKGVILLVGVNGSGKTTCAAKVAYYYRNRGRRVLLAAADTFRAAGSSQLSLWGERLGIPVIAGPRGADPGSVVFNSMQAWQGAAYDLLVIDTAGRMQSQENLMRELEKITRVIGKFAAAQPDEAWLVLDASTGQNALVQAQKFKEFSRINGLVLAKLDGTAKGGTVVSIAAEMGLPVLFAGHGEGADDLWEFQPAEFVDSLLGP
ncbi:MAG: signal recognition particle-docking protein FtsY [Candidatus Aminicenantes bacterium]|nr:signal recognition particle-docking protein FtsY [Candidatus Aminicenantes bacterium]